MKLKSKEELIKERFSIKSQMDSVNLLMKTAEFMKVIGKTALHMDLVKLLTKMGIATKESLLVEREKVRASIFAPIMFI